MAIYLANHGHTCLHFPGIEVRVKRFNSHQLCFFVLSTEDVDQTIQLHHTKVLTSLRKSVEEQSNWVSNSTVQGCEVCFIVIKASDGLLIKSFGNDIQEVLMLVEPFNSKNHRTSLRHRIVIIFLTFEFSGSTPNV